MSSNGLLHDGIGYWARRTPDKPAVVIDDDPPITYAELARWSDGVAARLTAAGVGPGDRVAIAAANCPAWAAVAAGVLKAGGIITPMNDRLTADELAYLAGYSDPRVIVADEPRAALLAEAGVTVPVIPLTDTEGDRAGAPAGWSSARVDGDAVAMIIFTSGSTARPKGAMMTHGNYLAKFHEMRLLDHRLGPDTRSLMPLGLHSSPGTPWGIFFTTLLGGTLYATRKYRADRTLEVLARERISFFLGVPMIYDAIAREPGFGRADLSALSFARVGGASASPEMLAAWAAKGVVVRQLYGMTEVGGGSIIATEEEARAKPMSCGRGLAFSRFRVVRDDGSPCDADEPGHVLLQGPGLMAGYWREPHATAEALRDGWMHTGDIGAVDAEGYFTFLDRSKEMIKSGGFNVSPSEVEAVLGRLDGVVECAVFAVPDERFAEVPFACVRVNGGGDGPDAGAIHAHLARSLAKYKLPAFILAGPDPLPRLANEKIDRRALKARYADPAARPERIG